MLYVNIIYIYAIHIHIDIEDFQLIKGNRRSQRSFSQFNIIWNQVNFCAIINILCSLSSAVLPARDTYVRTNERTNKLKSSPNNHDFKGHNVNESVLAIAVTAFSVLLLLPSLLLSLSSSFVRVFFIYIRAEFSNRKKKQMRRYENQVAARSLCTSIFFCSKHLCSAFFVFCPLLLWTHLLILLNWIV